MNRSLVTIASLGASLAVSIHSADAQDLLGRHGLYDATYDPEIRTRHLDLDAIRGVTPTRSNSAQGGPRRVGAPSAEVRRNFVYVQDPDGSLPIPLRSTNDLFELFNFTLGEVYRVVPDEFLFVYFFTSFDTGVGAFFYSPEANSTSGIGFQTFDQNGRSPREGFVFMNYWRSFEEMFGQIGAQFVQGQARHVFNQEAGHRWMSYVTAGAGSGGSGDDILRGRDDGHWSYFLDSGGSPMEGNSWRDNGNGSFTTLTSFQNWHYSELDQYLMGLRGAAEVAPMFVIESPVPGQAKDITGQTVNRSSPPQIFSGFQESATVRGTRVDLTINDIISRNGFRAPPVGEAPTRFRSVFVMLAGKTSGLSEAQKKQFEGQVDEYAVGFHQGTSNRAELDYILMIPKAPMGGDCASADDCDALQAGLCVERGAGTPGVCTRVCDSRAACPASWCCQPQAGQQLGASMVCVPSTMCAPEVPDAGVTSDAGAAPTCTCNASSQCDAACGCDPDCTHAPSCTCDVSTACDPSCDCDPECGGPLAEAEIAGCGCATLAGAHADAPDPKNALWAGQFVAALAALALRVRRRA